jgi:hypothetical protein
MRGEGNLKYVIDEFVGGKMVEMLTCKQEKLLDEVLSSRRDRAWGP